MAVLPLKSVKAPSDLTGQPNGKLNTASLKSIGMGGLLHPNVARGWFALASAARKVGFELTWTPGGTYRPYSGQLSTFLARYQPVSSSTWLATPGPRRKTWPSALSLGYNSQYWVKKNIGTPSNPRYPATAAVPGTSNHGIACAIDAALGVDMNHAVGLTTVCLNWMVANAHLYGFAWSLQSEPWHIQWTMGDAIPQAVLTFEKGADPLPPEIPAPPLPYPPPTTPPVQPPSVKDTEMAEYLIHYPAKPDANGTPPQGWTLLRMVGLELQHIGGPLGDWLPTLRANSAGELVCNGWEAMVQLLDRSRAVGEMPKTFGGGGGDLERAWQRAQFR